MTGGRGSIRERAIRRSAGQLVDVGKLVDAYYSRRPDPAVPAQRVAFGTSGHRGSSFDGTFNEAHVLAITQAICLYRRRQRISGPLFVGFDTHALSRPAFESALEVLAANGVNAMIARGGEYTPTPAISRAILVHNRGRKDDWPTGSSSRRRTIRPRMAASSTIHRTAVRPIRDVTSWIEKQANALLADGLRNVQRLPFDQARRASTVTAYDFLEAYTGDLGGVIDFDAIRSSGIRMGVDPLGGAGVHYWSRIAERYRLDLTVVSEQVDPTFRFMTLDWDGRIRMDPSSSYAMQRLIGLKDKYDIAFACDTDHDRHGIVTPTAGLMKPNHFLAVAIDYLFCHRPDWKLDAAIGKTVVSTAMIDRVAARLGRRLHEVPVGFKWFADGLFDGSLGFGGEESAGASFLRRDGSVWTTDKDGIASALLSAEITARTGQDPSVVYRALTRGPRRGHRRSRGGCGNRRAEAEAGTSFAAAGGDQGTGGRAHPERTRPGTGQRRADWRDQGHHGKRMVCRAPVRHRGHLQGLRRELQRRGSSAGHPSRGTDHRRRRACCRPP